MIYCTIWVSIYSFKCFKTVWSGLFTLSLFSPCSNRLDRNGMLLKFLCILITVMHFKDRNWIPKTVNYISCLVVCKIASCSEFPDIPDNTGKVTKRRRRRTQAIAKRYAFHANATNCSYKHHQCNIKKYFQVISRIFDAFDSFLLLGDFDKWCD